MVHFFTSAYHLFRTVTMYPCDENGRILDQDRILDEVMESSPWFGGRFARGHRETYMETRRRVEARMYEEFSAKYREPKTSHPVFFYIRPNMTVERLERELAHRRELGETKTSYLLIDLANLPETGQISFTVFDSHRSYRMNGANAQSPVSDRQNADAGRIFHIREIADVYERNRSVGDLSFEVQVWDPSILEAVRRLRVDGRSTPCPRADVTALERSARL
jgi:hypothetical protein